MPALDGKVALVTGGARRIGRALSLALAKSGAHVVLTFRNSADEAESLVRAIRDLGRESFAIRCDVRHPDAIREAVAEAIGFEGHLDLLINNAGAYNTRNFEEISLDEWDEVMETNARAPFLFSQLCAPALRLTNGRIINIGSLGGIRPWATHAHYCASKAALHMLTQASAKALAPHIAVNAVAPGMIYFGGPEEKHADHFAAKTPMQRNGTAQDVADAVLYLATCTEFITGQILTVDGGLGL